MFDIGWSELVVIGVVALIAIGPKELPGVLRTVGQYMGKVRRMASEFQSQFQEAMREAEMADIKKSVDEMTESATKQFTGFDPVPPRLGARGILYMTLPHLPDCRGAEADQRIRRIVGIALEIAPQPACLPGLRQCVIRPGVVIKADPQDTGAYRGLAGALWVGITLGRSRNARILNWSPSHRAGARKSFCGRGRASPVVSRPTGTPFTSRRRVRSRAG